MARHLGVILAEQKSVDAMLESGNGKSFSTFPKDNRVATPSKIQLAIEWYLEHPEDKNKSGRELAETAFPQGVGLSHKSWNDAKKLV